MVAASHDKRPSPQARGEMVVLRSRKGVECIQMITSHCEFWGLGWRNIRNM